MPDDALMHSYIFSEQTRPIYVHTLHFACNCYLLAITCSKYFLQRRQELMTLYAVCQYMHQILIIGRLPLNSTSHKYPEFISNS